MKIKFVVLIIIIGVTIGFLLTAFVFNAQANQDIEDRDVLVRHTVTYDRHNATVPVLIVLRQDSISMSLRTDT